MAAAQPEQNGSSNAMPAPAMTLILPAPTSISNSSSTSTTAAATFFLPGARGQANISIVPCRDETPAAPAESPASSVQNTDSVEEEEGNDTADTANTIESDEEEEGGDNDHNRWYCNICKFGGELLCCDRCPRAYHLTCLKLNEQKVPEKDWYCPFCSETLDRRSKKKRDKEARRKKREEMLAQKREEKKLRIQQKDDRVQKRENDRLRKKAKRMRELSERTAAAGGSAKKPRYKDKDEEKLGKLAENLTKGKHGSRIKALKKELELLEKRDRELKKKEEAARKNRFKYPMNDFDLQSVDASLVARPVVQPSVLHGIPSELMGALLFVWDFVFHFHTTLALTQPLTLEQLRSGLLYTDSAPLITELHYRLLSMVLSDREDDDYVSDDEDAFDQDDRWHYEVRRAPLTMGAPTSLVLTHLTWPAVLANLINAVPRFHTAQQTLLQEAVQSLQETEYPLLSLRHKLELLAFLVNRVYAISTIRDLLRANLNERLKRMADFYRIVAKEKKEIKDEEKRKEEELKKKKAEEVLRQKEAMEKWLQGGNVGPKPGEEAEAAAAPVPSPEEVDPNQPTPLPSPTGSNVSSLADDVSSESDENDSEDDVVDNVSRQELLRKRREKQEEREAKLKRREARERQRKWVLEVAKKRESVLEEIRVSLEEKDLNGLTLAISKARDAGLESGRGERLWRSKELINALEQSKQLTIENAREQEALTRSEEFENAMSEYFIRTRFLGMDKHFTRYWSFVGDAKRLYVEKRVCKEGNLNCSSKAGTAADATSSSPQDIVNQFAPENFKSQWFCYRTRQQVDQLIESLDVRGIRERHLKQSLLAHAKDIKEDMPDSDVLELATAEDEDASFLETVDEQAGVELLSVKLLTQQLRKMQVWIATRLSKRESSWEEDPKGQAAFNELLEHSKSVSRLADPLLLLEAAVFKVFEKAEEKPMVPVAAAPAVMNGDDAIVEELEEEEDEEDDDGRDEPIVDNGSQLWPTRKSRERWREAVKQCGTLANLAVAMETFIQRCDIVGICEIEYEETSGNRRARTENEKRSRKELAAKKKAEKYVPSEDEDEEEEDADEEEEEEESEEEEEAEEEEDEEEDDEDEMEFDEQTYASPDKKVNVSDEWDENCYVCSSGGELICCDGCTNVFHLDCIGLRRVPRGESFCNVCKSGRTSAKKGTRTRTGTTPTAAVKEPQVAAVTADQWDTDCAACGKGGELLCCDGCPMAFHVVCAELEELPNEDWFCNSCAAQECGHCHKNKIKLDSHVICGAEDGSRGCDRVFHLKCAKLKKVPAGDWFCAACRKLR